MILFNTLTKYQQSAKITAFGGYNRDNEAERNSTKMAMIENAKYMSSKELTAGSGGNMSVRVGDRIYITTAGSKFNNLSVNDICEVDINGNVLNAKKGIKPSSELPLHLEVYKQRKDVNSVIHFHPVYTSVYAVANKTPIPYILPHTTKHFSDLKVAPYENAGSKNLASTTVQTLGNSEAVIMGNHGALVVGKDLPVAVKTADSLENYSKISYLLEDKASLPIHQLTREQVNYMRSSVLSNPIITKDANLEQFRSADKTFVPFLSARNNDKIKLVDRFLNNDETITVERTAVSANANIYKISDGKNQVAVKMKHFTNTVDGNVVQRKNADFTPEISTLKQIPKDLTAAHILGEIVQDNNILGIAMDYIPGKPLKANEQNLNVESLPDLYSDFLKLDEAEIFHRDLSINNIINSENKLHIIDFGAAKTYSELKYLQDKNTKYTMPDFIYPSNLENFEFLALLTYLKQLSNLETSGDEIASEMFKKHLGLKADYHKQRIEMLKDKDLENKGEIIKNETILYKTFDYYNKTQNQEEKTTIKNTELLRLKTLNSQKMTRLFFENDTKNFVTGIYWNYQDGFQTKAYYNMCKKSAEKYKDNKILSDYFNLQMKLADFHYENIYKPTIKKNTETITKTLENNDEVNINSVINDGNILSIKDVDNNWIGACAGIYNNTKTSKGEF